MCVCAQSSTPLLDTSAQRSKGDLGKRRIRTRPSRSLRGGLAPKQAKSSPDWRTCDSTGYYCIHNVVTASIMLCNLHERLELSVFYIFLHQIHLLQAKSSLEMLINCMFCLICLTLMFLDERDASSKQRESDSEEEQPKPKIVCSPPPASQRVPMFPGLSPSALIVSSLRV